MKNVKQFCKEHKKGLIFAGCVIGAAVIGGVITNNHLRKKLLDTTGKSVIYWVEHNKSRINLVDAKVLLEAQADTDALYALIKEGADVYNIVQLNGTKLTWPE